MNLKVTNMVVTGKTPFSKIDVSKVIRKSKFFWVMIREDISPILQTRIEKGPATGKGKRRHIAISLFRSGTINIVGVTSKKEADEYYKLIVSDLKRIGF